MPRRVQRPLSESHFRAASMVPGNHANQTPPLGGKHGLTTDGWRDLTVYWSEELNLTLGLSTPTHWGLQPRKQCTKQHMCELQAQRSESVLSQAHTAQRSWKMESYQTPHRRDVRGHKESGEWRSGSAKTHLQAPMCVLNPHSSLRQYRQAHRPENEWNMQVYQSPQQQTSVWSQRQG